MNKRLVSQNELEEMIEAVRYRGPDDQGYFVNGNIGLGHCRLSIVDLTRAGHQPMADENQRVWIVHNGEIYNYIELRSELESLGYRFKSNTDTEVILYSYKEWGEKCLEKFNGMWAFAIWDADKKELFCSRDRFGVKPLYYFFDGRIFAFASEIKSLLHLGFAKKANTALVYDFLYSGMLDHTDQTFFDGIQKLPASSWLKINLDGKLLTQKYWDFEVSDMIENKEIESDRCAEIFLQLFIDSVKIRLRSDVAVGSCLSGGLDSSAVVCVINNLLRKENIRSLRGRQRTFSSCFDDKRFDEREYINEVIGKTLVEGNYVFPKAEDFLEELDKLIWHQEEPFAGTSIYAQWQVLKTAKKTGITVILDGQGGDENLCGYRKFYLFYLNKLLKIKRYDVFLSESLKLFFSLQIMRTSSIGYGLRYFKSTSRFNSSESFLGAGFVNNFRDRKLSFGYDGDLGKRIKDDIMQWSLPVLLRYEDKSSMAHSVEARLPFLDYRLVKMLAGLPLNQKIRDGWTKFVLRNAMKGVLPDKIRLRKSKLGFDVPQDNWFKGVLKSNVKEVLDDPYFIMTYINKDKLAGALDRFFGLRGTIGSEVFFRFYILELWGRKFNIQN